MGDALGGVGMLASDASQGRLTVILGRSPNLWIGAITALYGLADGFHVAGFAPTDLQNGLFAVAVGAIVALVANSTTIAQSFLAARQK